MPGPIDTLTGPTAAKLHPLNMSQNATQLAKSPAEPHLRSKMLPFTEWLWLAAR